MVKRRVTNWGSWHLHHEDDTGRTFYTNADSNEFRWEPPVGWGWEADFDDKYKRWYYYNMETDSSTWKLPEGIPPLACLVDEKCRHIPYPLEWKHWAARLSRTRDHWYYFDVQKSESTWVKPAGWGAGNEGDERDTHDDSSADDAVLQELVNKEEEDEEDERKDRVSEAVHRTRLQKGQRRAVPVDDLCCTSPRTAPQPIANAVSPVKLERLPSSSRPRPKQGRKLEEAEEEADGAAAWLRLAEQKRSRAQDRRKSAHVPPSEEKPAASSPSLLQPQQQQQGRRWSADAGRGRAEEQGPTTASRMVSPRSMKRPITQATRPAASQGDGAGSVRNASFPGEVDEKNVHVVNSSQNKATEAGVLAEWLRTEGDTAAFKVDMGDFGRPITRAGVMAAWRAQQGEHLVFSATHKSVQVGHIELLTSNVDPSQAWCHWAGTTRFSLLAYVYVIPFFRSKKVGTAMVRKVCNYAFSECRALKVLLLIQETNEPLARFYKRIGFSDTGQCFYRGDEKTLLLELTSALEGT